MSLPASISLKSPGADKYLLPIFLIVLQNMMSCKSQVTCPSVFFLLCDFIYMYEYVFYLRTNEAKIIPSHIFYIITFIHAWGPLKEKRRV